MLQPKYCDARSHDVTIYPICINNSYWDNTLETDKDGKLALRLGFRQVIGLTKEDASWITAARGNGYSTIEDIWRRAGIKSVTLNRLAEADAFISIGMNQREAIWQASAIISNKKLPLFDQNKVFELNPFFKLRLIAYLSLIATKRTEI